jgi:hypothetical protein
MSGEQWEKPPVHFFQPIFLRNFRSKFRSFCQNWAESHHVMVTFILALQQVHPLNTEVINFCNTELLNVP